VRALFLELARPAALLATMFSLLAVMHTAFFGSERDFHQRMYDSLGMLLLAAGFAFFAGLLFEGHGEATRSGGPVAAIVRTFPVRVFFWTAGLIVALFLLARWIEAYCIFSPEMRF
jgi:cation transport ATPase